jgi:Zn-dependent peptidase ImmA (M78 family)
VRKEANRIRNALALGNLSVKQAQFFEEIEKKLVGMGFRIIYETDELHNIKFNGQNQGHIPSITIYDDKYKKELGGRIFIYDGYSRQRKRELLIHELVHIMDSVTPTWSTNLSDRQDMYMLLPPIAKRIELVADLIAMELMMPNDDLQNDLFTCSYNIGKIVTDYRALEISTVTTWIVIHDYFLAHYAMYYQAKDESNRLYPIDEYSHVDSKPDVANIVLNTGSIAYKSWYEKQSHSGESTVNERGYQCFCFYEKDGQHPLPSGLDPLETIMKCDKLVIIGWPKHIYNFIQQLQFKHNSTPVKNP